MDPLLKLPNQHQILIGFLVISLQAMRQAKEEEQADIEEFDENNIDKGDDTVRYANFI